MKLWVWLLCGAALGATPDCSLQIHFTNRAGDVGISGQTIVAAPGPSSSYTNTLTQCTAWYLSYSSEGFSALSIQLESAPQVYGGVGTFVAFQGTTVTGSNPSTTTTSDSYSATGYYPYVRVNLLSITGTGSINATLHGWYSPNYIASTSGSLPSGAIVLIATGTCPTGFSQVAALSGTTLLGTVAANGDVGTTGGSDTITPQGTNGAATFTGSSVTSGATSGGTPAGTNSTPIFTGDSNTVAAQVFTGTPSSVIVNHTHTITSVSLVEQAQGGTTASTTGTHVMTSTATGGSLRSVETTVAANKTTGNPDSGGAASYTPAGTNATSTVTPTGAVSAPTFTGNALSTHTHTVTAAGTNSAATFTGTQFDNRSAFTKVIFCQAI